MPSSRGKTRRVQHGRKRVVRALLRHLLCPFNENIVVLLGAQVSYPCSSRLVGEHAHVGHAARTQTRGYGEFDVRGEAVLNPRLPEFLKGHGHVTFSLDAATTGVTYIQLRCHNVHPRCISLNLKRLFGCRCRCRWGPKSWFARGSGFRHGTGCLGPSTSEPCLWQTFQCSHKRCRHA